MRRTTGWIAAAWTACGTPPPGLEPPTPPSGLLVVPLLRPPFQGVWEMDNPFDHVPGARVPGDGEVWTAQGGPGLGTRAHRGYDWPLPVGEPVLAAADGVVVAAGARPPFPCPALGRTVQDQLHVLLEHTAPDGSRWQTGVDHLSTLAVEVGAEVRAGAVLGASGATGCALGPHLHFTVARLVDGKPVAVDPYGWAGEGADPWMSEGATSPWMWAEAPVWFRERAVPAVPSLPVSIVAVRYQGWQDEAAPGQERVRLMASPQSAVSLAGWRLTVDDGLSWTAPAGSSLAAGALFDVVGGVGDGGTGWAAWGAVTPVLPDPGGTVRLFTPDGREVQAVSWGLASRREPPAMAAGPSCPDPTTGCWPLPVDGPVRAAVWSPDGRHLAVSVGDDGARALVVLRGPEQPPIVVQAGDGSLHDPGTPAWLSPDLLVFDALVAGGARRPWSAVVGARAAPLVGPEVYPGDLIVRDAAAGTALLQGTVRGQVDLVRWAVGDEGLRPLTRDRREEGLGLLAPDGVRTLINLSGELWEIGVGEGRRLAATLEDEVVAGWWGTDPAWVLRGELWVADAGGPRSLGAAGPMQGARRLPTTAGAVWVRDGSSWIQVARDGSRTPAPSLDGADDVVVSPTGAFAWRVAGRAPASLRVAGWLPR